MESKKNYRIIVTFLLLLLFGKFLCSSNVCCLHTNQIVWSVLFPHHLPYDKYSSIYFIKKERKINFLITITQSNEKKLRFFWLTFHFFISCNHIWLDFGVFDARVCMKWSMSWLKLCSICQFFTNKRGKKIGEKKLQQKCAT